MTQSVDLRPGKNQPTATARPTVKMLALEATPNDRRP